MNKINIELNYKRKKKKKTEERFDCENCPHSLLMERNEKEKKINELLIIRTNNNTRRKE